MRALLIGGTGNISLYVSKKLLKDGWELYLLNRGNSNELLISELKKDNISKDKLNFINADIRDEKAVLEKLEGLHFDTIAQFIAYLPDEVERDIRLFLGKCNQYIFISSASCYKKPCLSPYITESTPLYNPYWKYSRDKAKCEELLYKAYMEKGFPVTIVRPSHTYGDDKLPLAIHGHKGSWQTIKRILENKPVIIPGDGSSLWTLTHSRDFAVGFVGIMGRINAVGESFHITSDESVTWLSVYKTIARYLNRELVPCFVPSQLLAKSVKYDFEGQLVGDKSNSVIFDNSKIKRFVPEFKCAISIDIGIEKALKLFLENKDMQTEDTEFENFQNRVTSLMFSLQDRINMGDEPSACEH